MFTEFIVKKTVKKVGACVEHGVLPVRFVSLV